MKIGDSLEELLTRTIPHATASFINKNGPVIAKSISTGVSTLSKELVKLAFK